MPSFASSYTSILFPSGSIPGIDKCVNFDLLCLKTWMESNKVSHNVPTTQTLLLGGRKKVMDIEYSETHNLQIVIGKEPVSKIKHTKYLGIEVDQHLNWEEHISAITKKISKGIGRPVDTGGQRGAMPPIICQTCFGNVINAA